MFLQYSTASWVDSIIVNCLHFKDSWIFWKDLFEIIWITKLYWKIEKYPKLKIGYVFDFSVKRLQFHSVYSNRVSKNMDRYVMKRVMDFFAALASNKHLYSDCFKSRIQGFKMLWNQLLTYLLFSCHFSKSD